VAVEARQCKKCKKLFQYMGNPLCHACIKLMDMKFNDVRDYIYENPHAAIEEVCEATEVDKQDIHRWLTEGRLVLVSGSSITLFCEKCGAPILTGKQCEQCLQKLRSSLSAAADSMRPKEASEPRRSASSSKKEERMHIADRKKST
jgi:hypothetical protein